MICWLLPLPIFAAILSVQIRESHGTEIFLVNSGAPLIYAPFTIEDARTAGMGRVTAIPRDGTVSAWWNPAFLAFGDEQSLSISNADLSKFSPEGYVRSGTVSGPLPWGKRYGAGLGVKRLSFGEVFTTDVFGNARSVDLWEQAYVAAIGYGVTPNTAIGISLEYIWYHIDPDPTLNTLGSTGALSASFGVGYRRPIDLSTTSENVQGASRFTVTPMAAATFLHLGEKLEFGRQEQVLYRQLRGAVGIDIENSPPPGTSAFSSARIRQMALATAIEVWAPASEWAQISQRRAIVHFGTEITLFGVLSGRIGFINDNLNNRVPWDSTHGLGIALPSGLPFAARFDWAAVPWGGSERIERRTFSIALRPRT